MDRPGVVPTVWTRFVLRVCRSVRTGDRNHLRTAAADAGSKPPGEYVVATRQPHVIWRHRLRRVLLNQRGQRIYVVALERSHAAVEQRALAPAQALHCTCRV